MGKREGVTRRCCIRLYGSDRKNRGRLHIRQTRLLERQDIEILLALLSIHENLPDDSAMLAGDA